MIRIEFEQDQELFKAVDADNNGLLNKQEFTKFTNPEEHQDLSQLLLKQILRTKDADNDEALNFKVARFLAFNQRHECNFVRF